MIVKFLGATERRSKGCKPCGMSKGTRRVVASRKEYILPSGATKTFYLGRETEVSDDDGKFLTESFPDSFIEVK